MPQAQPNIVLIHSDQHRFDSLGCTGHPLVRTPNLDRLAAEGVCFRNAFTPSPICSPARASLLSGQWPTQHGCINIPNSESYRPMHENLPTLFDQLNQAGYDIGYVGKFHQETARPPTEHGVDEFIPEGAYGRWRNDQGLPSRTLTNGWFGEADPEISADQSRLAWGADHVLRMVRERAERDRPFLVRWDPSEPHLPCIVPEPYTSMYPPDTVPPWPSFPDELTGKPYVQQLQRQRWDVEGWSWDRWAPVVSRYLGEISLLDAQIGRILDTLDQLGLSENTLVVYTTDHGDFCGGHGMMDKHFSAYDDIMRVPLLMRFPARLQKGQTCDHFISHSIDLATTLCAAAGAEIPDTFQGRDLIADLNGDGRDARTDIFCMYQGCQMGLWSTRMVRDQQFKLVYHATAKPEFYDVTNDPGEQSNRADDPAVAADFDRLRHRLLHWMESIDDPLLNPWTKRHIEELI